MDRRIRDLKEMKPKMMLRVCIDLIMTILLLVLMGRQISGESAHEWLGALLFVLWIIYHLLNARWYGALFRGRYTLYRSIQTIVNILLMAAMLATMVSAVTLSRGVFAFLPISGGIALARSMHIAGAFWTFVLMSLHLGLHWNMVLGMIRKMIGSPRSVPLQRIVRIIGVLIAAYGLFAFIQQQFPAYLTLSSSFVFFDFTRPAFLFYLDHLAIMGLFVFLAHMVTMASQKLSARKAAGK